LSHKFFNIGEQPETEITRLHNKLAFPVNVFEKYNGFLGLLTSNPDTGELMYYSKSSNDSPHTGYLKAVVTGLKSFGLDPAKVAAYCKENNVTLVCECIDPVHDPHIVPEDEPYLILLDVIHNSFETQRTNYLKLLGIANKLCIPYKRRVRILETFTDFTTFCRNIKTQGEGYVLEDVNGYMLKIKSPSYNFWKKMRSVKECMEQNRMYGWYVVKDEKYKPYYNRALEIMREMKKAGTLENASIVDIRRQVERELG
jgi:tRNA splicing ligase